MVYMKTLLLAAVAALSFGSLTAQASPSSSLYVQEGATGTLCSRQDPCGEIQRAVDLAESGDTVRIGRGTFVENIWVQTPDIRLIGARRGRSEIISAGGRPGAVGNANNPLDAIIEVNASDLVIRRLTLTHPSGNATKRDAAVFAWPGSDGIEVTQSVIRRLRDQRVDEPTSPGSRGVFILLSRDGLIERNRFSGNYQDHVHLPTGGTRVTKNVMVGAARAGISVMDPDFIANFPADNNVITRNLIMHSIDSAIHIQGDQSTVTNNILRRNGGFGVYLCGPADDGCYPPGANAVSEDNFIADNLTIHNALGPVADFGVGNHVE